MKRVILLMIFFSMTAALIFTEGQREKKKGVVELVIPHYKAGQNVGGKFFLPQVERFNKAFENQYHITIEEVPQDGYFDKIKILAQQNKLPALIESAEPVWFESVMLANDRVYDLKPWIDQNPQVAELLMDDAIEFNSRNGKIVSLPMTVIRPIGLFYNNTMVKPSKRIGEMNFEELAKTLGKGKIAFMTSENAWTTSLFFTALIAAEPGGINLLKSGLKDRLYNYTDPILVDAVKKLQRFLQNFASGNTLGAAYADAANAFMAKQAAIIPNGPWMVGDFASGSKDKWSGGFSGDQVSGDIYPGNFAIANASLYNWWIPKGLPQREVEAALAFLGFMMSPAELEAFMLAEGGVAPKLKPSESFLREQNKSPLLFDLATAVNEDTRFAPNFLEVVPGSIANVEWGKLLPKLIDGSYSPEEFMKQLTIKAEETKL